MSSQITTEFGTITLNNETMNDVLKSAEDLINRVPGVDIDITGGGEKQLDGFWNDNKQIIMMAGGGAVALLVISMVFKK